MPLDDTSIYVDTSLGFAEAVSIAGVSKNGIFDISSEIVVDDVISTAPVFTGLAADLAAAAAGQTLVRTGTNYKVRQVLQVPPDGALTRLVLARA